MSSRPTTNSTGSRRSCTSGRSTSPVSATDAPSPTARHSTSGASSSHPSTSAPPQPRSERRSAGRWPVRQGNDGGAPVEVPEDIVERIRALCLALPEVAVRVDGSLTRARSTAWSFDIRRRSICLLVAREDSTGKPVPLLVLRVGPDEREALLSIGYPFLASRAGHDRVVVVLTDETDWEEIRELVTESYRILAPKKLVALLGEHRDVSPDDDPLDTPSPSLARLRLGGAWPPPGRRPPQTPGAVGYQEGCSAPAPAPGCCDRRRSATGRPASRKPRSRSPSSRPGPRSRRRTGCRIR